MWQNIARFGSTDSKCGKIKDFWNNAEHQSCPKYYTDIMNYGDTVGENKIFESNKVRK